MPSPRHRDEGKRAKSRAERLGFRGFRLLTAKLQVSGFRNVIRGVEGGFRVQVEKEAEEMRLGFHQIFLDPPRSRSDDRSEFLVP